MSVCSFYIDKCMNSYVWWLVVHLRQCLLQPHSTMWPRMTWNSCVRLQVGWASRILEYKFTLIPSLDPFHRENMFPTSINIFTLNIILSVVGMLLTHVNAGP